MRAPSAGCPASLQGSRRCQQGGSQEAQPSCRAHRTALPRQSSCGLQGPASLQGKSMSPAWLAVKKPLWKIKPQLPYKSFRLPDSQTCIRGKLPARHWHQQNMCKGLVEACGCCGWLKT